MNYLIFDNDIYYDNCAETGIVSKDKRNTVFGDCVRDASIVVIDTLQKQVAAPEKPVSKKDEVIAGSFIGDYVTQSERIAANLFQVIAIEKAKINEIYKHLGFENVRLVVPYGVALREFLKVNNTFGQNKRIVFLDYLGNQVLLTIFNNELFTTPRRLSVAPRRIVSELTRSQENYRSQNKSEAEISFLIATNNKEIMEEIISSGADSKENIVYFSQKYPALNGLMTGKFSMHYLLPEQFIRLRRQSVAKRRVFNLGVMSAVLAVFLILLLGSRSMHKTALMRVKNLQREEVSQEERLKRTYLAKYKDILRRTKKTDLPYFVSSFVAALPRNYKIESMSIRKLSSGNYRFEAIVFQEAEDGSLDRFILRKPFTQARLENILVRGSPGIRVVLDILNL